MSNSYSSLCDDFYLDMSVNTELDLPEDRDTILAFFERIQRQFPDMCGFYRRDKDEYCLDSDRNRSPYRWVSLEKNRIGSGIANPINFSTPYDQAKLVLELMPYMLSVNHLDIDSLDVTFGMDFDCKCNHDEVISEALFGETAFSSLLDIPGAKAVDFSPSVIVSLSQDCLTQARVNIESKTSIFDNGVKRGNADEPISLSFTVRQYPSSSRKFDPLKSFDNQCRMAEELMADKIVPNFVKPLIDVIAQKRSS